MASGGVPRDNMEMSRFQHGYLVDNTLQYCPEDEDDHHGMFEDVVTPVLVNDPTSRAYRCSLYPRPPQSGFRWYPTNSRYPEYPMAAGTSPDGEAPNAAGGIYCDDHRYSYGEACANVATGSSYRIGHQPPESREPTPRSSCSSEIRTHAFPELCIYLKNDFAVNVDLEEFPVTAEIVGAVAAEPELNLGPLAEEVFQLWLVSPLLEVQLKPHHRPLTVRQQWVQLLTRFTEASSRDSEMDEPIVTLQRNVFYPKKEERNIRDPAVLELLQAEARCNVLEGRYPCSLADAYTMAALQAKMELGKYDPDVHTPDYFRSKLDQYLPYVYCGRPLRSVLRIGGTKSAPEHHLVNRFRGMPDGKTDVELTRDYLELCWKHTYYGSAFFHGQVEKPRGGLVRLLVSWDAPVLVAISSEGLTVIDSDTREVMLSVRYEGFSWDATNPSPGNNPDRLPCLFLQFEVVEDGHRVSKVLQVFSKQVPMMDALIASFVNALQRSTWDRDDPDGVTPQDCTPDVDDADAPLTMGVSKGSSSDRGLAKRLNRLSLVTFSEDGECIRQSGSGSR